MKFFKFKRKNWLTKEQYIFLYCLIISFAFWILIKLSNQYSITVSIPVEFTEIPQDQYLSQKLDSTIDVKIEGQGLELIGEKYFSSKTPVSIPLDRIPIHTHKYSFSKYILIRDLPNPLNQEKNLNLHRAVILTDTISFVLENSHQKTVPVKPNLTTTFQQQYELYDSIHLNPDSITISGPHSIISKIKDITTKKYVFKDLSHEIKFKAPLIIPSENKISTSAKEVEINIPVEKFTEETIHIPIKSEDNLQIKFFPSEVQITYQVAIKDYSRVKPEQFNITAKKIITSNNRAKINIKTSPSFIKIKKINPQTVEYLILK
ncbi:MAG: CdaR family protein [Bacteroidales bacterium]